jgi:hypothetical protein
VQQKSRVIAIVGTTEEMETDASLQKEQSTDETGTEEVMNCMPFLVILGM